MRALGLHAGDLDDSPSHWMAERRASPPATMTAS